MKHTITLLFFAIIQMNLFGQPAPCSQESLDIVENIQNTDYHNTEISTKTIQLKINPKNYYKWSDIIIDDRIDTNKLILENSGYKYCSNIRYKSKLNNRFYLTNTFADDVLIIQNGNKKMYIVYPTQNRIENEYFFGTIVDSLNKLNTPKGKRAYYNPNRYITNIEFKEGIFFIKDYDKKFGIKSFKKNDVTEFYPNSDIYDHRNPEAYWNNKVSFVSMFDERKGPEYSKMFPGNYTEDQAIEIMVKNHPRISNEILKSIADDIKQKHSRTVREEELLEIWYALSIGNVGTKEVELLNKLDSKKSTIEEVYNEYKEFKKSEFFSILKSDSELTFKYYEYFLNKKTDLKPFKAFIQKSELKFNKEQLKFFIENIEN